MARLLTPRQVDAFEQRPDESGAEFLARTMRTLPFRDLPELMLLRSKDQAQMDAIRLYIDTKMVVWTRALAIGTVLLGICTIIAAFIVAN